MSTRFSTSSVCRESRVRQLLGSVVKQVRQLPEFIALIRMGVRTPLLTEVALGAAVIQGQVLVGSPHLASLACRKTTLPAGALPRCRAKALSGWANIGQCDLSGDREARAIVDGILLTKVFRARSASWGWATRNPVTTATRVLTSLTMNHL